MSDNERPTWQPVGFTSLAAASVVREVKHRLRDQALVLRAAQLAEQQSSAPDIARWQSETLAHGDAGYAVLCSYLDCCFPDEQWAMDGHNHLMASVNAMAAQRIPDLSLYAGLAGVMFAAQLLSQQGTRYTKLLATLDAAFLPRVAGKAQQVMAQHQGLDFQQYDVIVGLTGIGVALFARKAYPTISLVFTQVLTSLVHLTYQEDDIPHWYTPPTLLDATERAMFPQGNVTGGMAHGIAGPLALLALAYRDGYRVPNMEEAIHNVAQWLIEHALYDQWGINWKMVYPVSAANVPDDRIPYARAGWCYGAPGIARALWLAGQAVGAATYRQVALEAMAAVYQRPIEQRDIPSPTFCHGIAGLLHITQRFGADTQEPLFREAARMLLDQLLAHYDARTLLGFQSIENDGRTVDHPGILDGAGSILLVLLASSYAHEPVWDRMFLLA